MPSWTISDLSKVNISIVVAGFFQIAQSNSYRFRNIKIPVANLLLASYKTFVWHNIYEGLLFKKFWTSGLSFKGVISVVSEPE